MRRIMAGFHGSNGNELRFGEQLHDDLINSFCDKIQLICPKKIEALFAIQFLSFCDSNQIKTAITGDNDAYQVIYDHRRSHYILVHYDSNEKIVMVYDSMQIWGMDGVPVIFNEIVAVIKYLFGHIFGEYITIQLDREFERQKDTFSCGYRVVGAIIALARGENPSRITYNRAQILHFMQAVLDDPSPKWEHFERVDIGSEKNYAGDGIWEYHAENQDFFERNQRNEQNEQNEGDLEISESQSSFKSCEEAEKSEISLDSLGSVENYKTIINEEDPEDVDMISSPKSTISPPIPMDSDMFGYLRRMFWNGFGFFQRTDKPLEIDG